MPDPSFVLPLLLQSAIVPFAVALAVLAACHAARLGAAASVLAVAAGFLASYFASVHGQWSLVPKVALDWLPWTVVLGVAGALAAEGASRSAVRHAGRLGMSLAAAVVVVWPALESFGAQKAVLAALVIGVLVTAAWTHMAHVARRRATPPFMLGVVAGGAGLALMLDSSLALGQLHGALASVLAACVAFGVPRVRVAFSPAAAGVAVLVLGTLLANAHLYAGFSLGYVALLAGGLAADALLSGLQRLRRRSGEASWAAAVGIAAIPVVVTIGLAVRAAHEAGGY